MHYRMDCEMGTMDPTVGQWVSLRLARKFEWVGR